MFKLPRRLALLAALASVAVLSAASDASATVTPEVDNNTLTVTSNDDGDAITLAAAGGFITVNGTATTLAADGNAQIVVNAGGGNDTVDATALGTSYGSLKIDGGEGDDLLTGGAKADVIEGGAGEDRVVGFKGEDELFGGDGNDVLVWNNGDSTDSDVGGAGTDEVEVNGAPTLGDVFVARPNAAEPGAVIFERTNLVKFEIDLQAERLTVNGLGGSDSFQPDPNAPTGLNGLTSLTLNGGSAADVLAGGDGADQVNGGSGEDSLFGRAGADQINGGDGNDTLEGEGGDDRLVGATGSDTQRGGEGDDVLVWNNGDGSDPENQGGAGFDRVEVNGSPTADDLFKLEAGESGATFQRTNLVPFTLGISSDSEVVAVNGAGGADELSVQQQGQKLLVAADGGAGDDRLSGGNEADSFFGGSGNDMLSGGGGSDLLDGGEGNDGLFARDQVGDLVRGGIGADSAQTDRVTVDAIDGVETLDATPAPVPAPAPAPQPRADTTALPPKVGKVQVIVAHGKPVARVPLACPASEAGGCRTALTLETAKAVNLGRFRAVLVLGSKSVDLAPGQRMSVSVRISAAAGLATHGKLATRIEVASSDAAGNSAARSLAVGLRIPRR
jgi:Ca2+-binding RTX toxin-like protein